MNTEIVTEILKGASKDSIATAASEVAKINGKYNLDFKIPFHVTDENTKNYIKEMGLENPEKLVLFLVEVSFASIEVIIGSVNDIQVDTITDYLQKLNAVKEKIAHDLTMKDSKERLRGYQNELIDLRYVLEGRVRNNIQRIKKIDKMGSFERKIKAAFIEKNVDLYTKSAKLCLQAFMEIVKIQIFIADYIGDKNFQVILNGIDNFMQNEILSGDIAVMSEWSLQEDRAFWTDAIQEDYDSIVSYHRELPKLFESMDKRGKKFSIKKIWR